MLMQSGASVPEESHASAFPTASEVGVFFTSRLALLCVLVYFMKVLAICRVLKAFRLIPKCAFVF